MIKKILKLILVVVLLTATLWLFLIGKPKTPKIAVVSSVPKNNSSFVDTKGEIIITLDRKITQEEGGLLKIKIYPHEKLETVYQENKVRISPEDELKVNTKYEISVIFNEEEIYKFSFTTFPFTQEQIIKEGSKQTAADIAFGEKYKEFLKNYPWYQNLPIEKKEYRVVYDFETGSFRIRFKISLAENEKQILIENIKNNLKKLGVKEPIKYYTIEDHP